MAKKKMIMIADDEIGIHESLRIYLTREGYEVFSVFRGDEVMSAFERMRNRSIGYAAQSTQEIYPSFSF